jgi:hypothetical protein
VKRILDIASAVLVVVALALGWRVVQVLSVPQPRFQDAPQLASAEPVPPMPRSPIPRGPEMDAIVERNLFETERGKVEEEPDVTVEEEEPLPPPTNVVLNGVFYQLTGRPMAIMTDAGSGNRQLTLHEGDNLGDYQVGRITRERVTLLGRGGQEFSLQLDVSTRAAAPARRTPAAARPNAAADRGRAAQSAAQRAAEARRQQANRATPAARGQQAQAGNAAQPQRQDPTEARLEALRRLREAARER